MKRIFITHIAPKDTVIKYHIPAAPVYFSYNLIAGKMFDKVYSILPANISGQKEDFSDEEVEKLKQELTGELIEYQLCRIQAQKLAAASGGFDRFIRPPGEYNFGRSYELVHSNGVIYDAYLAAVGRGRRRLPPPSAPFVKIVAKKIVSVSTKIVYVMRNLIKSGKTKLNLLYSGAHSRSELVATFLAVLELCKANRVKISGNGSDAEIKLIKEHKQ